MGYPELCAKTLACLKEAGGRYVFEPYTSHGRVDEHRRFRWELARDFPFAIQLLLFSTDQPERPMAWHEYLELFIPVDSPCRLKIGSDVVSLGASDVLVVDNVKLHAVLDFPGDEMRAIVIRFLPDFVYSLGTFSLDHLLCLPFYYLAEARPRVLRRRDAADTGLEGALARLLECYFDPADPPYSRAGVKVFFLEILYYLARHFHVSASLHADHVRRQERASRLRRVFDYVDRHPADKILVKQAAGIAAMSRNNFLRAFKEVAGMTWVDYLNQVRPMNAARLLKETGLSIAEVASRVGFADQSYSDRRFNERFSQTPWSFRSGRRSVSPAMRRGA